MRSFARVAVTNRKPSRFVLYYNINVNFGRVAIIRTSQCSRLIRRPVDYIQISPAITIEILLKIEFLRRYTTILSYGLIIVYGYVKLVILKLINGFFFFF